MLSILSKKSSNYYRYPNIQRHNHEYFYIASALGFPLERLYYDERWPRADTTRETSVRNET